MTKATKVLIAGATGYLGQHIVEQLTLNGVDFVALARNKAKLVQKGVGADQILEVEVTEAAQLEGVCDDVDVVISCLGITRQKDGLSYMDVDYQANLNLLQQAEKSRVKRFIYISAFKAQDHPHIRILRAKEMFASRLLSSRIPNPCVIRPNGFFADLEEVFRMARAGKVYQFGQGEMQMNPIHGQDLAQFCIEQIGTDQRELDVGGPEVLSLQQIAHLAFQAQNISPAIRTLPDGFRRLLLKIIPVLPEKWVGPAEFFLTMIGSNAVAPLYGKITLAEHFADLK
ncbi:SDR family oxidoreductase [Vibrio sp. SCSIO 43136]|uniref:SDR family oxidoreductase n=1 Tax=Vibrio sp. SCSIO 43136 TaxID=2819101 RepID=UPI0020750866|nr:SDR family oxidoreductase [Vibrio sp. SCSIO 43136]USD68045.1 SDR family oxidoreductase [Vibrio sp. SCSIO 43136]